MKSALTLLFFACVSVLGCALIALGCATLLLYKVLLELWWLL